jgi:hypothetical protein
MLAVEGHPRRVQFGLTDIRRVAGSFVYVKTHTIISVYPVISSLSVLFDNDKVDFKSFQSRAKYQSTRGKRQSNVPFRIVKGTLASFRHR